uniref:Uncharacterized protein n=1 Tax=Ciona savignyi TaxID=51511 RepID=H2ZJT5_CIOSA
MTTEIDWPLIYNGIYTATNNAFSIPYFHSCLYVKLNVPSDTVPPVINVFPNKSASWTVTSSDWLNSVASGDVTGSALIYASNNWNRGNIYIKKMPRMVLSQCDIVEDQINGDENVDNANKEQGLKLVFRDANTNTDLNGVEKLESYRRARTYEGFKEDVFKPHDSGILKMRWNPNLSSYTCIATATNSGLVRLSRVEGMISHDLEVTQQRIIAQDV